MFGGFSFDKKAQKDDKYKRTFTLKYERQAHMNRIRIAVLMALSVMAFSMSSAQAESPKRTKSLDPVADHAELLTQVQARALETELASFKAKTGYEVAVITVSLGAIYPVNEFAKNLDKVWGAGNRVILLIESNEPTARIVVGRGLVKKFTRPIAQRVILNDIAPQFSKGKSGDAVMGGARGIMRELKAMR